MHVIPDEIKDFWEKRGYQVKPRFSLQPEPKHSILWDACKNDIIQFSIALTIFDSETYDIYPEYYWEGKTYSEKEILKIFKLKTFT